MKIYKNEKSEIVFDYNHDLVIVAHGDCALEIDKSIKPEDKVAVANGNFVGMPRTLIGKISLVLKVAKIIICKAGPASYVEGIRVLNERSSG